MSEHEVAAYLCIGCPLGCRLEVEEDDHGDVLEVRGFDCKKGKEYGRQEHTEPKRMVTTTVAVRGTSQRMAISPTISFLPRVATLSV